MKSGKVLDVVGQLVEASMPECSLGTIVEIQTPNKLTAEVIGFRNGKTLLLPYHPLSGIFIGARVDPITVHDHILVGDHLIGEVVDPFLRGLQHEIVPCPEAEMRPIQRNAPNPLKRARIENPLALGIRALDGLLTFGEGQRTGIMAGSGVGKVC